ncbi:MAG: hydroxyethylthiazole kinase [Oscillospiraceae bacterium]|nr:hydroxyethylthiazole kinase [Oscillospiraceae bacterium]
MTIENISKTAVKLAQKYDTMILASGKTDIVTDGKTVVFVNNGVMQLAQITGTGCLLGMLCGCYLSVERSINALITACAVLGICGELSQTEKGNGTFFVNLMDNLSVLKNEQIEKLLNIEVKAYEEL